MTAAAAAAADAILGLGIEAVVAIGDIAIGPVANVDAPAAVILAPPPEDAAAAAATAAAAAYATDSGLVTAEGPRERGGMLTVIGCGKVELVAMEAVMVAAGIDAEEDEEDEEATGTEVF